MKRVIIFLICIFAVCTAYGATMCIPSDTYWALLDPDVDGLSSSGASGEWIVTFDYETAGRGATTTNNISGLSACNEVPGTVDSTAGAPSTGPDDTGVNCWCEMTKPLISEWVFINTYASDSACASSCTTACATRARTTTSFRTTLYGSVW